MTTKRFNNFHDRQKVRNSMLAEIDQDRGVVDWAVIGDTDEFFWGSDSIAEVLSSSPRDAVALNFGAKLYLPTALDAHERTLLDRRIYRTSNRDSPIHSSYRVGKSAYRADWLLAREPDHICPRHEHLCQDAAQGEIVQGDVRVHHYMIQDEDHFVEKAVRLIEWAPPPAGPFSNARWRVTRTRRRNIPKWSSDWKKKWWGIYQAGRREALRYYYRSTYVLSEDAVSAYLKSGDLLLDDGLARSRQSDAPWKI